MGSPYDVPRHRLSPRSVALNVGLALAIAAALFTWFRIANLLTAKAPRAAPLTQRPTSFAWGNRVFTSSAELNAWLTSNGINAAVWLRRHPDAARIIGAQSLPASGVKTHVLRGSSVKRPSSTKTAAKRPSVSTKKVHPPTVTSHASTAPAAVRPASSHESASRSGMGSAVVDVLVVLALLLAALTFAPTSVWRLLLRRIPMGFEERLYAAAGAAAILVALGLGSAFH
ncbi:MAG: hypothetical protein ACRDLK_09145 [Gaiellaceae bacterium]